MPHVKTQVTVCTSVSKWVTVCVCVGVCAPPSKSTWTCLIAAAQWGDIYGSWQRTIDRYHYSDFDVSLWPCLVSIKCYSVCAKQGSIKRGFSKWEANIWYKNSRWWKESKHIVLQVAARVKLFVMKVVCVCCVVGNAYCDRNSDGFFSLCL